MLISLDVVSKFLYDKALIATVIITIFFVQTSVNIVNCKGLA